MVTVTTLPFADPGHRPAPTRVSHTELGPQQIQTRARQDEGVRVRRACGSELNTHQAVNILPVMALPTFLP